MEQLGPNPYLCPLCQQRAVWYDCGFCQECWLRVQYLRRVAAEDQMVAQSQREVETWGADAQYGAGA